MENKVSLLNPDLIKVDHDLYTLLKGENAPLWWKPLKEDNSLYIEIRKKNIIDVYFYGGRMAEIAYDRNSGSIVAKAHPKYLGHNDVSDKRFYRHSIDKKGNEKISPLYQDCQDWLLTKVDQLKENIKANYSKSESGELTKEKFIQGNLIISHRDVYLDSEFAHRFHDNENETIRIDMVKIENNKIVFEELKRIGDNRLRKMEGEPEILTQIRNYREFLQYNKDNLTEYYKRLYKIKKNLELPIPKVDNIEKLIVDPEPQLLIALNYEKMTQARKDRKDAIESVLKTENIVHRFI